MSIHRTAARNDANHAAVVKALEAIGCLVVTIRQPVDLLIGYRGVFMAGEIKDGTKPPSQRKLKPIQAAFFERCTIGRLPCVTLLSPEQAVGAVVEAVSMRAANGG